ncbi:MAG: pyruvate kinase, partial [Verrucomicrobiae bacterium]|nr:pyruvate kinase [Verrucomicrobiae bacterium]
YAELAEMDRLGAKMVKSALVMAHEVKADAVIVFTRAGSMARNCAWLRPTHTPLYAFTDNARLLNQLTLFWGIRPFQMPFSEDPAMTVASAVAVLKGRGLVRTGGNVVAVTEVNIRGRLVRTVLLETVD